MFENIEEKIKQIAKIIFGLGVALCGIFVIASVSAENGFLILLGIIAFFACWVGAIFIYAFGLLLEKVSIIADNTKNKQFFDNEVENTSSIS